MNATLDPCDLVDVPSPANYEAVLSKRRVSDMTRAMLCALYSAPARTLTAGQLAIAVGLEKHYEVNFRLGPFAASLCRVLDRQPRLKVAVLVRFCAVPDLGDGLITWTLLPEVATALERLGWVRPAA